MRHITVTMRDWRLILAPVLLLAQTPMVHWAAGRERTPMPPALWGFPQEFGSWKKLQDDPIAADVGAALQADRLLSRTYLDTSTNQTSNLFVAWFRSERAGTSQPHSPKWCLPAAGWAAAATGEVTLETSAGAIRVNRYVVVKHEQRVMVLYWYQGPHRVTAGEWETKLWLLADALWDKRTDTALVRVVVQSDNGGDRAATAVATRFAERLYPLLRENLPQ
jgi:EpsI family protein